MIQKYNCGDQWFILQNPTQYMNVINIMCCLKQLVTFIGRPLVSMGNSNAARADNTEMPIRVPMAAYEL